ncbi:glycosyltransferase family 2 protein [Shewanella waksmanii]|uniref:glycosyltransferase family 2 protein n=1 Tax=Shewanella waksmanii TaxID=213783 RepID=UPI00373647CA
MKISLIITTYNWPEALKAVLESVLRQSCLPDEVIIADDGSGKQTEQLIKAYQSTFPVPLHHSWQQDKGFRLSRSRNQAIDKANHDYIVMIDGDMVLEKNFIADHKYHAQPARFITGKRVKMNAKLSGLVQQQQALPHPLSKGIARGRELTIRCRALANMLSHKTPQSTVGIHGCNLAFWRQDVININGFNEEFEGWGPEDKEFAQRMINAGILRKVSKFSAVAYHLDHQESCRAQLHKNDVIFQQSINAKLTWCRAGISEC